MQGSAMQLGTHTLPFVYRESEQFKPRRVASHRSPSSESFDYSRDNLRLILQGTRGVELNPKACDFSLRINSTFKIT